MHFQLFRLPDTNKFNSTNEYSKKTAVKQKTQTLVDENGENILYLHTYIT